MPPVDLDDQTWQQIMNIISDAPWKIANPLLMQIGAQLRAQQQAVAPPNIAQTGIRLDGEGKEVRS